MSRIFNHHNLETRIAIYDLVEAAYNLLDGNSSDEYSSVDIVACVKDFLNKIPRDNIKISMEHLQLFDHCGATEVLCQMFNSPIKKFKEIGEESIRLFLNPQKPCSSTLPRPVQNQCAFIISQFCFHMRATKAKAGPLYNSCQETLGSLLKSIGFANRSRYFGNANTSTLIEIFYPYVRDLSLQLGRSLSSSNMSSSEVSTIECLMREFTLFALHLRRAIEDHFKSTGQLLPVCHDDDFDKRHPCCMKLLHRDIFHRLLLTIKLCMVCMKKGIEEAGGLIAWEFNHRWSYYLSVIKEIYSFSKFYQGAEEKLVSTMRLYNFQMAILVKFSKRSDDHHQWLLKLLKHTDIIDFKSRIHLMMMMFPEVNYEDDEKLHKMLINRSQLLAESFEQITHAHPRSLRNGLFVEFKNEVATGDGVLREWIVLVCQALFDPETSLFLECPYDRRRFFPNPAKVNPLHLNYFRFCGQVIALALMHNVQVGIAFDRLFFLQLAGEGLSLEDVRDADPCLYKSWKQILEMDADFMDSDSLGLTFIREIEESGSRTVVELCPGGNTIAVNSKNREEYVHLLIQHYFVKSISKKVAYFARGFGDILSKCRLQKIFFQSLELKDLDSMLLGSDEAISVKDWKAHTDYDDYKETDDQICWFWEVVEGMSSEQQSEILFFWTSVKYLPLKGFSGLPSRLFIYKASGSHNRMPFSHTCFYRLALPRYPSLAVMQQHLFRICQEHVGSSFGFS